MMLPALAILLMRCLFIRFKMHDTSETCLKITRSIRCASIYFAARENRAAVLHILLDHVPAATNFLLQLDEQKATPLMFAAMFGADEAAQELLRWGANPNAVAGDGTTALSCALDSKCLSTISLLAPVTNTGLGVVLGCLAKEQVELTKPLRDFVARTATDGMTVMAGLKEASKFGHSVLVKLLAQGRELPESFIQTMLKEAVKSDSKETCALVLALAKGPPTQEVIDIAKQRGRRAILKLLAPGDNHEDRVQAEKRKLKQVMFDGKVKATQFLPKSQEFKYNHEITRVAPLLEWGLPYHVTYGTLLQTLYLPTWPIHWDPYSVPPYTACPLECLQTDLCKKMREIYALIEWIVATMGEINPVFKLGKDRRPSLVGSLKEGTRCFFVDELDVHVSLNKRLRKFCYFDTERQQLKVKRENVTDEVKQSFTLISKYLKEDVFDCEAFFADFVDTLVKAIRRIDLSLGFYLKGKHHEFTMLPLTLDYTPCLRCMDVSEEGRPHAKRCRHHKDCAAHHDQGLPECMNNCIGVCDFFSHERTCNCKMFTSPSVTITKIGAAIHVGFSDGTTVDCDLNVPTIPTFTQYDGSVTHVRNYLSRVQPVGWL